MSSSQKIIRAIVPRGVRNWMRSPSHSIGWALDEVKFAVGITKNVEMRPGWTLVCHPAAYRSAYFAQTSDPEQAAEFDCFIKHTQPDMLLFDIGAHFGLFSLAAIHYGGPSARAVAVDPSPTAERFIKRQAALNHVSERLQVLQACASDETGWRDMVSVGVLASGYFVAPSNGHSSSELTRTRAVTLDHLAEELSVTPTHIKIDVEGDEAAVLRGSRRILSQAPSPLLFIELHNEIVRCAGGDPSESLRLLRDYQYRTFAVDGQPVEEKDILSKPLVRIFAEKSV